MRPERYECFFLRQDSRIKQRLQAAPKYWLLTHISLNKSVNLPVGLNESGGSGRLPDVIVVLW